MGPRVLVFLTFLVLAGCARDEEGSFSGNRLGERAVDDPGAEAGPSQGEGFPVHIQDATGSSLIFQEAPARILSLVPSATRTLQAVGAQGFLVGRTEYDTDSSLAHLPSVGGGLDPSLETLVALEPDLVIRFAGESDSSTPNRLMDTILADIQARVRELPRVRVAYILGGTPPWVAGPDTFIHELLAIAGGENVFSDLEALYGPVSLEEFLVRDIDLLLAPEGAEVLIPATTAPLVRVPPTLELPGPDLAEAARNLAEILHPGIFR